MSDAIQMNTPSPQSLGEILRLARQEQGLELSDVAQVTHVRKEYLKALDEGRYNDLPEDVYSKNFLRLYAQAISLDEKPLLQLYSTERHGQKAKPSGLSPKPPEESESASPVIKPQTQRRQSNLGGLFSTLLLVLLLVLAAVWGFNRFFAPAGTAGSNNGTISGGTLLDPENTTTGSDTTRPPLSPESTVTGDSTTDTSTTDATNLSSTDDASDNANISPEVDEITNPDGIVDVSDAPVLPDAVPTGDIVSLTVLSNPAGAQVFLDNFPFADVTPIELAPVTSGENRILRVELEGYQNYEGPLDLSFDRNIEVSLNPLNESDSTADEDSLSSQEGQIRLSIEAASWLEVYQGTARSGGPTLLYRTVEPGESFSFDLPVYLHVGNGAGIRYSVNGQDRGTIGSSGQVVSQAYVE